MRGIEKMKNKKKPVQERKMRIRTTALCRSLFGDEETQMIGNKQKVNGGYFRGVFFTIAFKRKSKMKSLKKHFV